MDNWYESIFSVIFVMHVDHEICAGFNTFQFHYLLFCVLLMEEVWSYIFNLSIFCFPHTNSFCNFWVPPDSIVLNRHSLANWKMHISRRLHFLNDILQWMKMQSQFNVYSYVSNQQVWKLIYKSAVFVLPWHCVETFTFLLQV